VLETPKRDRRNERHEATRAEILEAAWTSVRRDGLAALSLRELARSVGMQPPSLYSYFDSKNAIYDAMYADGCREFVQAEAQVPRTGDLLSDLKTGIRFFVGFCTDDPAPDVEVLLQHPRLAARRACDRVHPHDLDLMTALGTGLADQQISNDPGGDRWILLVDEAVEMLFNYVTSRAARRGRNQT